ncbi:MAG: hypothetical protein AAF483_11790 [Planctomycetota bacterium]
MARNVKEKEQVGQKKRSRFFRISLRTAFVALFLFALFLSQLVMPAVRQREARSWLESQRADYGYSAPYRPEKSWYMTRHGLPIPRLAIEWFGIDLFACVTVVVLQTDEIYSLQELDGLEGLEELYINQFVHPQVDFSVLQSLKRLRKLELSKWSGVEPSQVRELSTMLPNVEIAAEVIPESDADARSGNSANVYKKR